MRQKLSITLVVLCIAAIGCWAKQSFDQQQQKAVFQGLSAVKVVVEDLGQHAPPNLTMDALQTEVELLLRQSGVRVLDGDTFAPANATLYVNVNIVKSILASGAELYSVNTSVSLTEKVMLTRKPSTSVYGARTWEKSTVGAYGSNKVTTAITTEVVDSVKKFANAYLAENPKP